MHPTYLRNIARCHQNLGDADKAISSFREYLRKARDLPPDQRAEIEGYIAEMEQMKRAKAAAPPPAAPARRAAEPRRWSARRRSTQAARTTASRPVLHACVVLGGRGRRRRRRRGRRYVLTADRSATHGSVGVLDLSN